MKALLIVAATWLLNVVPVSLADSVAAVIAAGCWRALPGRRRALLTNLRFTAPGRSLEEQRTLARRTFRHLAVCTVDFLRLPSLSDETVLGLVEVEGLEHLEAARARGRGVLFVSPHLGNFELGGRYLAARGLRVAGYAEEPRERWLRTVYRRRRQVMGVTVLPLGQDARAAVRHLKAGGLLALFADRAIGTRAHDVGFCGGRRPLPAGPAVLARLTGAAVLPSCLVLTPGGPRRYVWQIEPPIGLAPDCDDAVATQIIADRLSELVRRHPAQWFVFDEAWRDGCDAVRRPGPE